jgi:LacI family transcriptional regulator
VAHLAGPQHPNSYKNRRQGYFDALREAVLPEDEGLVAYTDMLQEQGAAGLRQLLALPNPPDAVFAVGDFCALGAMQEGRRHGLRVPEDVAIAGFGNESFTLVAEPNIATVDQRCEETGQAAVRLLLEVIDSKGDAFTPRQVALRPGLLVRGSSLRPGTHVRAQKNGPRLDQIRW